MAGIPSVQVFLGQESVVDGSGPTTRTNLCTNPSVEVDASGWTYYGGTGGTVTVGRQTGGGFSGSAFYRIAWSVGSTGNGAIYAPQVSVSATTTYTLSMWVRCSATTTIQPIVQFYNGGTATGNAGGTAVSCPAGVWTRIWVTGTSAGADTLARIYGSIPAQSAGATVDGDAVLVEQGSTLGFYFDGSSTCSTWTGTANASTSTSSWVDITPYVALEQGVSTSRGQSYGGGAQPGTASLTLVNTDGRFTLGNTGSPLSPYMRLQAPVKLIRDGRPWFVGRIMSAPLSWPAGGDSDCVVTVTLADKLARYDRMQLKSYTVEETLQINPDAYYPLTEPTGSPQAENVSAYPLPAMVPPPGVTFGSSSGISHDGGAVFTGTGWLSVQNPVRGGGPGNWAYGCAIVTSSPGLVLRAQFNAGTGGVTYRYLADLSLETYLGTPGVMFRQYSDPSLVPNDWYFFPASVTDGAGHSLVFNATAGPQYVALWVDGVAVAQSAGTTPTTENLPPFLTGSALNVGGGLATGAYSGPSFTGTISHVWFWTATGSAISPDVSRVYGALTGATLTTNAAFTKTLGWRGQAGSALIDAGITDGIPSSVLGNGTLATILGNLNSSEAGTLFVDELDQLTWKNRRTTLSPAVSLTYADIDPGIVYNSDLSRVQTLVTASRVNGGSAIVKAADYSTVGEITGSVSSLTINPDDALQHASWVANTGPRDPYIGSLKIDMATATPATYTAVASGGILTQVTLTGMPAQTPPNSTVLEVIGEQETISKDAWDVTWTVLPAGTGSARDVLILGDATYGVLGSTHRLAY